MTSPTLPAMALWLALVTLGFGAACGDGHKPPARPKPVPPAEDLSAQLFPTDRLLEVEITLAADDWQALRLQTRNLMDIVGTNCLSAPPPRPFTYFPAAVVIDGELLPEVGVRKKGFFGSLDTERPSLKIKVDELIPGLKHRGLERLTFNNCKQDPSLVKQCLGYQLFADAGVPAPRCGFAHVIVNGEDLGVFAHVESIDKDFLRRHFDDASGTLFEGALSDFRPEWETTFQTKTNETQDDRSRIQALTAALAVDDAGLLAAVEPLVDLDSFFTFWAAEVVIAHWDGYAGNTNNFYLYDDPQSGKLFFIPWGIDGIMFQNASAPRPWTVMAQGILTRRLYLHPTTQPRYQVALRELLTEVWDRDENLAALDRAEALIGPVADPLATGDLHREIDIVRGFVRNRGPDLLAELNAGPPPFTQPVRAPPCLEIIGSLTSTFSTTWASIGAPDVFASGSGTASLTLWQTPIAINAVGGVAGYNPDVQPPAPPEPVVQQIFALGDGTYALVHVAVFDPTAVRSGNSVDIDFASALGAIFHFVPATNAFNLVGFLYDGAITFAEASTVNGAPIVGDLDVAVLQGW